MLATLAKDAACPIWLHNEVPMCPLIHCGLEVGDLATLVPYTPALQLALILLVPITFTRKLGSDHIDYAHGLRSVTDVDTAPWFCPNLLLASFACG